MAEQMKKEAKARKKTVRRARRAEGQHLPLARHPAGWAFLIWPVIYLAESVFTAAQASDALDSVSTAAYCPPRRGGCSLARSTGCGASRSGTGPRRPSTLISGALLAAESVALGRAVHAVDAARVAFPSAAYWCGRFPLALHHGWITAAAVVNVNSWLAVSDYPNEISSAEFQARAAFISHAAAAFIGCRVSWMTKDPTFAGVIAWALYAIAADGGWRKRLVERIGEEPLRAIARNALFHARVASALCVYLVAKPLVDPYLPDAAAGLFSLKR